MMDVKYREKTLIRFWSKVDKVDKTEECWFWTASCDSDGYGYFTILCPKKTCKRAHHVAWFLEHGEWPDGVLRHTCDNPGCVNIEHLIVGTHADNVADRVKRQRSALGCKHGRSKLNATAIHAIRESKETITVLANKYKVDRRAISQVIEGLTWKHII